ncbi:AsmA family protein [Fulvimarina sp. 2208YS6-2-32]|uniref:AsmA family protein n=1 Tax=Fulvimarina uroteuthidis TaxID=3098149 RepID=A0ABU5I3Z5_9HYPH|nr:AsmA family protein [Fulvimarina sp. 2208YS6-2-32]MDY8109931.1 AsmA family protein [Fulvimarina sp. 2208YS6-2-32]
MKREGRASDQSAGADRRTGQGSGTLVRAFVLFGGLLVLALCAALVAPLFIDWSVYRDDFEREASRILGRDVTVEGTASARLLPFPSVTFEDVSVAGANGEAPFLTVRGFRMNAELAPYLSGEIRIFAMALDNPVLRIGADGLSLPSPRVSESAEVVLEDVDITDGEIVFADGSGIVDAGVSRLTNLDADLSAQSLSGPVEGAGTFDLSGEDVAFTLGIGEAGTEEGAALRLSLVSRGYSAQLDLDGRLLSADGSTRFDGQLGYTQPIVVADEDASEPAGGFGTLVGPGDGAATAPDDAFDGLRGSLAQAAVTPAKPPLRALGTVAITGDRLRSDVLRVEIGERDAPYVLTGSGEITLQSGAPAFRLVLEGETFDVDTLGAGAPAGGGGSGGNVSASLAARLETLRSVLSDVPKPTIDGTIELALPVVTFGDTTIRALAFRARPRPQGWLLEDLTAELPGRTLVEADGQLRLEPSLGYAGSLLVASRQPSGLSDWLTGTIDPKIRTLERAGLSANVDLTAERQTFRDLELDLGGDPLTGLIERVPNSDGGRLTARLTGGALDLDALRALGAMATGTDNVLTSVTRYDVALKAGPVRYGKFEADSVDADILYDGAVLTLAKLEVGGLAGASFAATGQLRGLGADTEGMIDLTLASDDPEAFLAFVDEIRPGTPVVEALRSRAASLAPLRLAGEIESIERGSGSPTLLLRLDGQAAATRLDFSAAIENGFRAIETSGRVGLELRMESDAPATLLAQLGLPARGGEIEGPLEIETSASASARGPAVISATLRSPQTDADFEGVLDLSDSGVDNLDSSVRLSSRSLGPWITAFGLDFGLDEAIRQQLDADLTASIASDGAGWSIADLSGVVGGNALQSDLSIAGDGSIDGTLRTDSLSLPWLASLVYGVDPLAEGGGIWSSSPIGTSLLPDRPISLAVRADSMDVGTAAIGEMSAHLESSARDLALSSLSGKLFGGDISGDLILRNLDGLGSFSADLRADEIALAMLAPALAASGDASDLTLTARLDATAQSPAGLVAALAGAGEATVVGAALPGIPSDPLPALLAGADAEGFSAETDTTSAFTRIAEGARFPITRAVSRYSVSGGDVILPGVTVSAGGNTLTLSGRIDLSTLDLDADLTLAIETGEERVEGAQAEVRYALEGPIGAPALRRNDMALANYLAVRALEREQARVEAMQERLEETLRLRRETRFYRWMERRDEARRQEAIEAELEARNAAAAAAATAAAAAARPASPPREVPVRGGSGNGPAAPPEPAPVPERPAPPAATSPELSLDFETAPENSGDARRDGFSTLPGVEDPLQF